MRPYKLVLDYEAVEVFQGLSKQHRRYLHEHFVYLREYPHIPDKRVADEHGRNYFIYVRGEFAIKYWIDEAVKEIRILDIHLVRFE